MKGAAIFYCPECASELGAKRYAKKQLKDCKGLTRIVMACTCGESSRPQWQLDLMKLKREMGRKHGTGHKTRTRI